MFLFSNTLVTKPHFPFSFWKYCAKIKPLKKCMFAVTILKINLDFFPLKFNIFLKVKKNSNEKKGGGKQIYLRNVWTI